MAQLVAAIVAATVLIIAFFPIVMHTVAAQKSLV
jgi:hypothetical protein